MAGGDTFIPLQLLTDFFPRRLPDLYDFDGPNATLRAGDPALRGGYRLARAAAGILDDEIEHTVAPRFDPGRHTGPDHRGQHRADRQQLGPHAVVDKSRRTWAAGPNGKLALFSAAPFRPVPPTRCRASLSNRCLVQRLRPTELSQAG